MFIPQSSDKVFRVIGSGYINRKLNKGHVRDLRDQGFQISSISPQGSGHQLEVRKTQEILSSLKTALGLLTSIDEIYDHSKFPHQLESSLLRALGGEAKTFSPPKGETSPSYLKSLEEDFRRNYDRFLNRFSILLDSDKLRVLDKLNTEDRGLKYLRAISRSNSEGHLKELLLDDDLKLMDMFNDLNPKEREKISLMLRNIVSREGVGNATLETFSLVLNSIVELKDTNTKIPLELLKNYPDFFEIALSSLPKSKREFILTNLSNHLFDAGGAFKANEVPNARVLASLIRLFSSSKSFKELIWDILKYTPNLFSEAMNYLNTDEREKLRSTIRSTLFSISDLPDRLRNIKNLSERERKELRERIGIIAREEGIPANVLLEVIGVGSLTDKG